jgi:chorismate-pyruvate lyase
VRWRAGCLAFALLLTAPAMAGAEQSAPFWPATAAGRAAAEARLDQLQQALRDQPSATLVLTHWCARFHLAPDPKIIAERVQGQPKPAPDSVRRNLALAPGETLGYRRVQLLCGGQVLSDADNWYVPDRLTPAMNALLDHSDTPFGLAVKTLHFQRRIISSETLWQPARATSGDRLVLPDHVLRNVGLLTAASGQPISQVIENYTAAVLGAPD